MNNIERINNILFYLHATQVNLYTDLIKEEKLQEAVDNCVFLSNYTSLNNNFCIRCGKRTRNSKDIHTCTPPHD